MNYDKIIENRKKNVETYIKTSIIAIVKIYFPYLVKEISV